MVEALRVLVACRKTAVTARKDALQMVQDTIVAAPDSLRDQLRILPDRAEVAGARYLQLHDELADLDAIIDELAL